MLVLPGQHMVQIYGSLIKEEWRGVSTGTEHNKKKSCK